MSDPIPNYWIYWQADKDEADKKFSEISKTSYPQIKSIEHSRAYRRFKASGLGFRLKSTKRGARSAARWIKGKRKSFRMIGDKRYGEFIPTHYRL